MQFRQLFDSDSSTYTYLLACSETKEAVLIDPILKQVERDTTVLKELGLKLKFALDTHVHADHISALGELRKRTECRTGLSKNTGVDCADLNLCENELLTCGKLTVAVLETPGHTSGCLTFRVGSRLFTGDTLLVRGCGRTDFQGGSPGALYDSVTKKLFTLPDETQIFPGHDYRGFTSSTIGEEKKYNPRLSLPRESFITLMQNLNLPNPKNMAASVPANQNCGRLDA